MSSAEAPKSRNPGVALLPAIAAGLGSLVIVVEKGSLLAMMPLPTAIIATPFILAAFSDWAVVPVVVLAAVLAGLWSRHLSSGSPILPMRTRILFRALTLLTGVFLLWKIAGGEAGGSERALAAVSFNVVWLLACGLLELWGSRRPSLAIATAFYCVLFGGFFSVAFPLAISAGNLRGGPEAQSCKKIGLIAPSSARLNTRREEATRNPATTGPGTRVTGGHERARTNASGAE